MNKKVTLEILCDAFYTKGERCDFGCKLNDIDNIWMEVVDMAEGNKNVYAIKDWMWLDLETDDRKVDIVKADYILRTSNIKFDIGDWVRTSPILNFTENCICETSNSFYILVGQGSRKECDESIFYFVG